MTKGSEPVYPVCGMSETETGLFQMTVHSSGLTKREYFAGLAMQALIIANTNAGALAQEPREIAGRAIRRADALITELAKEPSK